MSSQSNLTTLSVTLTRFPGSEREGVTINLPHLRKLCVHGFGTVDATLELHRIILSARRITHLSLYPATELHDERLLTLNDSQREILFQLGLRLELFSSMDTVIIQIILPVVSELNLKALELRQMTLSPCLSRCLANPALKELALLRCRRLNSVQFGSMRLSLKRLSIHTYYKDLEP